MAGPVQSVSFSASSGSSVTVTLSATGAGNCLIVYFGATQTTQAPTVSGITLGGAAGNFASAAGIRVSIIDNEIWTDFNAAAGQTSVVISWSGGVGATVGVAGRVEEWPGILATASPVDQTNTGSGSNASSWSSGATGTLSQPAETIVGSVAFTASSANTITGPSSPWANQSQVNGPGGAILNTLAGWEQVSSTATQTYSGTNNVLGNYAAVIVSLLQSPAAAGPGQGPYLPPRRKPARAVAGGILGKTNAPPVQNQSSGWLVGRTRHSDAIWGGIASSLTGPAPPPPGAPQSGWLVGRTRRSESIWGGIASSLTAAPGVPVPAPRQGPYLPPRRHLARALITTRPVQGINAAPVIVTARPALAADYDGHSWWKKRWILGL